MPCTGAGCGGIFAKFIGEDLESLRDECQGPDSDGDIRVGGRVVYEVSDDSDLDSDELKLFSKPGSIRVLGLLGLVFWKVGGNGWV